MSKKANPAMVGSFVVGAVVLAILTIVLFGPGEMFSREEHYILYFKSSVSGLEKGAPVKYRGVTIGQVDRIMIRFNQPLNSDYIPVVVKINIDEFQEQTQFSGIEEYVDPDKKYQELIKRGLHGKLGVTSYLTGMLYIELDFFKDEAPRFVQLRKIYNEIPTVNTKFEEVMGQLSQSISKLAKVNFEQIGGNIEAITNKLNEGFGEVDFRQINDEAISMMGSIKEAATKVDDGINPVFKDIRMAMHQSTSAFVELKKASESIDDAVNPDSQLRYQLAGTLDEIQEASRAIKNFVDFLERNPRSLLTGRVAPNE